jgi:hypothetical protein
MAESATPATSDHPGEDRIAVTHDPGGTQTLSCPHCGLTLTVSRIKGGTRITYRIREWKRRCKHIALDSPVLCLIERPGNGSTAAPGRPRRS